MDVSTVKKLIDEHGFTFEEIAYKIGCSGRSVENWYRGVSEPIPVFERLLNQLLEKTKKKEMA